MKSYLKTQQRNIIFFSAIGAGLLRLSEIDRRQFLELAYDHFRERASSPPPVVSSSNSTSVAISTLAGSTVASDFYFSYKFPISGDDDRVGTGSIRAHTREFRGRLYRRIYGHNRVLIRAFFHVSFYLLRRRPCMGLLGLMGVVGARSAHAEAK